VTGARLRILLIFLLIGGSSASAIAQFLDFRWPPDAETADATPAASPEPDEPPKRQPEPRSEPPEAVPRAAERPPKEPPPAIAREIRDRLPESLPRPAPPEKRNPLLFLFLSAFIVGLVLFVIERARGWLTKNVALTRVLGVTAFLLRLVGAGLVVAIVLQLIPEGQDWILWTLLVLLVVVGWSVRDLFADLVAGAVLAAERRVKKGVWVSGNGFQGTVEGRSLRATWLRDGQGHRLTVPNRALVGTPMVYDAGADAEHEVVVRLEGYEDAGKVRMALTDAILSSPWVLAGANPVVLRDPADPVVWRVRTKLLEPRFSVHFEGELLERVEDLLRHQPTQKKGEPRPSDVPPRE